MKKFLCVALLVALVACAITYPVLAFYMGSEVKETDSVGLYYNGTELNFPLSIDYLSEEGWYLYCSEPDGVLTLVNDKYDNMSVLLFSPNMIGDNLSDVQEDMDYIGFSIGDGCKTYPVVSVNGVSFGSSGAEVIEKMGTPVNDEGYILGDVPYHHYFFYKSLDEWTKASYEFVLVNGSVCDIKVSVDRLYGD